MIRMKTRKQVKINQFRIMRPKVNEIIKFIPGRVFGTGEIKWR